MKNSMKISLRIVHDGAERLLVAGPAAIVAFERHWSLGIGKAMSEVRVEHLAWLAHRAAWQEAQAGNGPAVKPFDTWLDLLDDIEAVGDEDDESPLSSAGTA